MKANSLEELAKLLEPQLFDIIGADDTLRQLIGHSVSNSVEQNVYPMHTPQQYKRRGVNGGLADPDNVVRTGIGKANSKIQMIYENITEGVDTLKGEELTDTIEEGIRENWTNPNGAWSEPRPFIEPAIEELKGSNKLNNQLRTILKQSGLDIK